MNWTAVWTKTMSQLNLAADFTVTIYREVSAWKTESSLASTGNTEFGGEGAVKK